MKRPETAGKAFALPLAVDLYSPGEIAAAAGVPLDAVEAALQPHRGEVYVPFGEAVRLGRALAAAGRLPAAPMFSTIVRRRRQRPLLPLALSSAVHGGVAALVVLVAGFNLAPHAAALRIDDRPNELLRMVFVATPGPGGGGGGGGLQQKLAPPRAMREGTRKVVSSPLPRRREPKPVAPAPEPPRPEPPLKAEQLPVVVAPIVAAPADPRDRMGVLEQTTAQNDSRGPGRGGGAGAGTGTGLGAGEGTGVGPGSGGGTGGGPYRPGSGITPPRLLREVKADYTEEARRRGIAGEVVLEIVVRHDGTVGDVRILQGLSAGLNQSAVQAVRQWRFAPAQRLGSAVDAAVEVAVEFKLR